MRRFKLFAFLLGLAVLPSAWGAEGDPLAFISIDAGGDGTVMGVTTTGDLWRWNGSAWVKVPQPVAKVRSVTVGSANRYGVIASNGAPYLWNGSSWQSLGGAGLDMDMSQAGDIWGVGTDGNVFQWGGSGWVYRAGVQLRSLTVGFVAAGCTKRTGDRSGGAVYYWNGSAWASFPGQLSQAEVPASGHQNEIWGVGLVAMTNGQRPMTKVYRWNGSAWEEKPSPNGDLGDQGAREVTVGNPSTIWLIDMNGRPFRWNGTGWQLMPQPTFRVDGHVGLYRMDASTNTAYNSVLTSGSERTTLRGYGWKDYGLVGYFPQGGSGTTPLYRLSNPTQQDHLYTSSASEKDSLVGSGQWVYEGVAGYVYTSSASGRVPLRRLWCPWGGARNVHIMSADPVEQSRLQGLECTLEGVHGYVLRPFVIAKISSINIWGIPDGLGDICSFIGNTTAIDRFKNLGNRLKREDADVVSLQEGFRIQVLWCQKDYADYIRDRMDYHPYKIKDTQSTDRYANSGLNMISKYPSTGWDSSQNCWCAKRLGKFGVCAGSDCYADKGVMAFGWAHFDLPRPILLLDTHLQAQSEYNSVRDQQIDYMKNSFFPSIPLSAYSTIFQGDFNFKAKTDHVTRPNYDHWLAGGPYSESKHAGKFCLNNPSICTVDLVWNTDSNDLWWATNDHAWYTDGVGGYVIQPIYVGRPHGDLTDHAGAFEVHYKISWAY